MVTPQKLSASGALRTPSISGFLTGTTPDVWTSLSEQCHVSRQTTKRLGYRAMWHIPAADVLQCWITHNMQKFGMPTTDAKLTAK